MFSNRCQTAIQNYSSSLVKLKHLVKLISMWSFCYSLGILALTNKLNYSIQLPHGSFSLKTACHDV